MSTEIALPVLKHGYRETPLSWNELQKILLDNDLDRLTRSVAQQQEYEIFKKDLNSKWRSMHDFVLCDKFNVPRVEDAASGKYRAVEKTSNGEPRISLTKNDYPYYLEDPIEHWILWKLGASCSESDILEAKKTLGGEKMEFLHWVNPPRLQSLPGIDHVHILCRPSL